MMIDGYRSKVLHPAISEARLAADGDDRLEL